MSGGSICKCEERRKPLPQRRWVVMQRHCNHSAFNGYHYTPSQWSSVLCEKCRSIWRTKADYVYQLKDYKT